MRVTTISAWPSAPRALQPSEPSARAVRESAAVLVASAVTTLLGMLTDVLRRVGAPLRFVGFRPHAAVRRGAARQTPLWSRCVPASLSARAVNGSLRPDSRSTTGQA